MSPKRNLIVYRDQLLAASETFILGQAESLRAFRPIYVGLERVSGLTIPDDRCVLLCSGRNRYYRRLESARVRLLGPSHAEITRLRSIAPVLVHAHFGIDASHAMSISRALRIPLLVTFHGYDVTTRDEILRRDLLRGRLYIHRRPALTKSAAVILCVSNYIRREVIAKGFTPERTLVHYTGVDTNYFTADRGSRSSAVLFVGRLVPKKGCEYLIRAMSVVQAKIPQAELVVIGDGPLRADLERCASSTLRSFRFLGAQSAAIIREWMNRASVFSTPSVTSDSGDSEGFGMVFAEAQSMGLPVASFATGGIPEAVQHGETGLLAAQKDSELLAKNIIELLSNSSVWQKFSDAGRKRVRELFDLHNQTAKLERIYQQVLARCDALASAAREQ